MTDSVQALRQQLQRLRSLHDAGTIDAAQYAERRAPLERELVDQVVGGADVAGAAPPPAAPAAPRPGGRLWLALGGFAVVLAGAGYWWTGAPELIGQPPPGFGASSKAAGADPGAGSGAADASQAPDKEQFVAMTERLAARLKEKPDDATGWNMLGRSYMALERFDDALAAFERAVALKPDDAGALADQADALAVKNGRQLDGEPMKLVERALKLDPDNQKALTLAGSAAFNRGDFAKAVAFWDRVVKLGPPDNPLVQQVVGAVAEARERGKLAPLAAADTAPRAAPAASVAAGAGAITGTVTLAPALRGKVAAEDVVFVFARPADGSRMPLAIVRKQVKDLPFTFRLDDSQAMSPAARISTAGRVVVGARISKSGQAMPQPGDLEGLTEATAVGSSGVAVVIAGEVK